MDYVIALAMIIFFFVVYIDNLQELLQDVTMANYTTGYLTYKKNTNQKDTSYLSFYLKLSKLESISPWI